MPDGALGESGRKVRCSACRHVWFQEPESPVDDSKPEIPEPVPADETSDVEPPQPVHADQDPQDDAPPDEKSVKEAEAAGPDDDSSHDDIPPDHVPEDEAAAAQVSDDAQAEADRPQDEPAAPLAKPKLSGSQSLERLLTELPEKPDTIKVEEISEPDRPNESAETDDTAVQDSDGDDDLVMTWPRQDDDARQQASEFDITRVVGPKPGEARRERGRGRFWLLGIIVLIVIVAGALYQWRYQVMRQFSQAIPVYVTLGLIDPPSSLDLRLEDVAFDVQGDGNEMVLLVTGQVLNEGQQTRQLPMLRGELLDGEGQVVTFWVFPAGNTILGPGEATEFSNAYADPPISGTATDLFVTFADLR